MVYNSTVVVMLRNVWLNLDHRIEIGQGTLIVTHISVNEPSSFVQSFIGWHIIVESLERPVILASEVVHNTQMEARRMMFTVPFQSLLIKMDRLLHCTTSLICQALMMEIRWILWIKLDSRFIIYQGFLVLSQLEASIAAIEMNRRIAWFCIYRSTEIGDGLFIFLHVVTCQSAVVQVPRTRVVLDSICEAFLSLFEVLDFHIGQAEMIVRVRVCSIQIDCLFEVLDGFVQLLDLAVANSQVEQCLVLRRKFSIQRLPKAIDRLVEQL
mmetsp:Transcript_33963/g.54073  ORF Transcript_33963/g.54073 Transcript_33963/m.54073 type:complete len:268 (+) Transcript_33963:863-1666(+)